MGRTVLVNSVLMSIHVYSLSYYSIPDSVLDMIPKLARNFLWGRGLAGGSFHSMNWDTTTLAKTKCGLEIINLRNVKISLITKNVFALLNHED